MHKRFKNLIVLAAQIRKACAISFSDQYNAENYNEEEMDRYITLQQIVGLLETVAEVKGGMYIISDNNMANISKQIKQQMYDVALTSLAAKGHLESYWDDERNRMMFRLKDNA